MRERKRIAYLLAYDEADGVTMKGYQLMPTTTPLWVEKNEEGNWEITDEEVESGEEV